MLQVTAAAAAVAAPATRVYNVSVCVYAFRVYCVVSSEMLVFLRNRHRCCCRRRWSWSSLPSPLPLSAKRVYCVYMDSLVRVYLFIILSAIVCDVLIRSCSAYRETHSYSHSFSLCLTRVRAMNAHGTYVHIIQAKQPTNEPSQSASQPASQKHIR